MIAYSESKRMMPPHATHTQPDELQSIENLLERLYPICRSITGQGVRDTLAILQSLIPDLCVQSVPTGTAAFDWTVPNEWNIREAWVKDPQGRTVVDFQDCNLHVVSYSAPLHERMPLSRLKQHLHTMPDDPALIPYRTSYYHPTWGFCMRHRDYMKLRDGTYEIYIDSTLAPGEFNYGELVIEGDSSDEVLFTTHICHPSMCNDNLSGIVVATHLAKALANTRLRHTYRFLFIPGGIGSIVWMSRNIDALSRIRHGLVLTCLGDPSDFTYKKSWAGTSVMDRAVQQVLQESQSSYRVINFEPYGYDERNLNSPRFRLPVGCLMRSRHSDFPGYHSSGDDFNLVDTARLQEALQRCVEVVQVLEHNQTFMNLIPEAEPQLGKRGLYGQFGGLQKREPLEMALLWVMNMSDGNHSLLDIAEHSSHSFHTIQLAAEKLCECGLLQTTANNGHAEA